MPARSEISAGRILKLVLQSSVAWVFLDVRTKVEAKSAHLSPAGQIEDV